MYQGYEYNAGGYGGGGGGGNNWFNPSGSVGGMGGGMGFDLGGGGGGGFLESGPKSAEKKSRDKQSLVPVSIKQLQNLNMEGDSNFYLDGKEVHTVKVVGMIMDIEIQSTFVNLKINDGTGLFDCKEWVDAGSAANESRFSALRKNEMVRVFGTIREFGSAEGRSGRYIQIFSAQLITDFNEVTYHLLDIIYVHLQRTKGPLASLNQSSSASPGQRATPTGANNFGFQMGATKVPASSQPAGAGANFMKTLYTVIEENNVDSNGAHIDQIVRAVNSKGYPMSRMQVINELERLSGEGAVFSGATDDFWLVNEGALNF